MDFRIADIFTDSLARLTGDEQKALTTRAFDIQVNPARPGLQFHKLEKGEEVYNTERHVLYVVCTRARDHLLVTGVDSASEFLDDLRE